MFESSKFEIYKDIEQVIKRHALNYDISNDKDLNRFVERILVANMDDPEVSKYLQFDKCEVFVQTEPEIPQGVPEDQINYISS